MGELVIELQAQREILREYYMGISFVQFNTEPTFTYSAFFYRGESHWKVSTTKGTFDLCMVTGRLPPPLLIEQLGKEYFLWLVICCQIARLLVDPFREFCTESHREKQLLLSILEGEKTE